MSCNLTNGISKGCRDNAGGIVEVFIGNFPTGYTANEWYLETDGTITSISGLSMYQFSPNKNSSNWVENIQSSIENDTIGYEQVVSLMFSKNEAELRNIIILLGQANLSIIVRDKNEKYWLLGAQNGLQLTGGNGQSGTLLNDMNGWSITIGGNEKYPAYEVSSAIITDLLA